MGSNNRFFHVFKIIAVNCLLLVILTEISLRLVWINPYLLTKENVYLHQPNQSLQFHHVDEIYQQAPDPIFFNTSEIGYIENSHNRDSQVAFKTKPYALAMGGSTTESATVQEDFRWTDLINIPTFNFGKSRMHSVNSYFNIKYLLESDHLEPDYIFVMDGINNLSAFLKRGNGALNEKNYKYTVGNPFTDFTLKNIYTISFLWRLSKEINYLNFYKHEATQSKKLNIISDNEFETWVQNNRDTLRKELLHIFTLMKYEASRHGARLVILSQPHSYREDYTPFQDNDLRIYPAINGQRTNLEQSKLLMELINHLTLEVAQNLDIGAIDTAKCFEEVNVSNLIYDAWHFTEEGCHFFASCVNKSLPRPFIENNVTTH